SFLAVGIIALGGIMWMLAAGNPGKIDKAKEMIVGALSGLVLLLCSWLILHTIDPTLGKIGAPTLEQYDIEAIPPHEGLGYGLTDPQITTSSIAQGAYADLINRYAQQNGSLPPNLVKAVILTESGGNPNAVSPAGAQGLMQLMPETANDLGVNNSFDPEQNIAGGTKYLGQLYRRYNGNLDNTLAAYNWGMGNFERQCGGNASGCSRLPRETQNYISRVKNTQNKLI
ncbi:MAG: Lytic transglycosylase domain protein, partial [Parcubacteria group bacterium GW2011_GWC2_42_6]